MVTYACIAMGSSLGGLGLGTWIGETMANRKIERDGKMNERIKRAYLRARAEVIYREITEMNKETLEKSDSLNGGVASLDDEIR